MYLLIALVFGTGGHPPTPVVRGARVIAHHAEASPSSDAETCTNGPARLTPPDPHAFFPALDFGGPWASCARVPSPANPSRATRTETMP